MHTCSHTLSVRTRVCAHDADFTVLPFLQPMSTTIYVYPSAWNTRMEMCHTCRWECDSCSKAWALCRFIYCFNDAVCFIFMYFVRNDEIKTVNCLFRTEMCAFLQSQFKLCATLPSCLWIKIVVMIQEITYLFCSYFTQIQFISLYSIILLDWGIAIYIYIYGSHWIFHFISNFDIQNV